jgi:2-methylisocitrate lyase-like PEP mutase family enzyme
MSESTAKFRQLHQGGELLRLPNAWDAASARLFESLGATAIATTSAGVAWSQGYPDGSAMPAEVVLAFARNLVRVLKVPLSVDIEDGYSDDPAQVAELAARLAEAGAAGVNLEDGRKPAALLARKAEAVKAQLARQGLDLFVNARTDVFLAQLVDKGSQAEETIARGNRYRSAGVDGLFVPGLADPGQIEAVVAGVALPLNLMAWNGLASAAQLQAWGVKRLSAGSGISQALWGQAEKLATDFLQKGESDKLSGQIPYGQMQKLFT